MSVEPTKDYLSPAMGRQVHVTLHNDSFDGRLVNYDMSFDLITLEGTIAGEPYTVHIKTKDIEAIMIQDIL